MKTHLLPLLVLGLLYASEPPSASGQSPPSEPLFDRLGDVITRADRDYFGLFPSEPEFAEARIHPGPDGSAVIVLDDEGGRSYRIDLTPVQADALRRYIDHFESLVQDPAFEVTGTELHGLVRPRLPFHPPRRIALNKGDGTHMNVTAVYADPAGIVYLEEGGPYRWPEMTTALHFIPVHDIRSVRTDFFHIRDVHGDPAAFRETVLALIKTKAYFYRAPPPEISRRFPVVYDADVGDVPATETKRPRVYWDRDHAPGTRRPAAALVPRRIASGASWLDPRASTPVITAQAYDADRPVTSSFDRPAFSFVLTTTYRLSPNRQAGAYLSIVMRHRMTEERRRDHLAMNVASLALTYEQILARDETRTPFIFEWIAGGGPSLTRFAIESRLFYNKDFYADQNYVSIRPGVFGTTYVHVVLASSVSFRGGFTAHAAPSVNIRASEIESTYRPLVLKRSEARHFTWTAFAPFVGFAVRM